MLGIGVEARPRRSGERDGASARRAAYTKPVMLGEELLDQFADALIAVDPDGTILFWSRGAEHLFGFAREDAVGSSVFDCIVPPDRRAEERQRLRTTIERGSATYESLRQHKNGSLVHVDVSVQVVRDPAGNVRHLAVSEKDVTHLQYLREAAALETRFRGVLEAAPDAMIIVNAEGRIVMVNAEAQRLFGYTREELLGQAIEMLVPERFRGRHPAHRSNYEVDRRTRPMGVNNDLHARRRDGSEFPAEISLTHLDLAEGAFTSAAIRDVTVRRNSETKFRGLLEAAPDAIVIVDRDGRIVIVNKQAELLFGYSRSELVGQSVDLLVPVKNRGHHESHRRRYFGEPRARSMGTGVELHAVRKDGSRFPVEISLSPLETEDGTLVSSAIRDVSARKATQAALELAYKELESFSYSIAHDLRAPLRGMAGFAQILREDHGAKLPPDGVECLDEIAKGAVRMSALIDALLSLSRVTQAELRRDRVDLSALARVVFAGHAGLEPPRPIELVAPDEVWAWADPLLGRNLIEILVDNAWKFTRKAADARIEIGVRELDGVDAFFVRDNGAGFAMEHATRLFAPFQRMHAARDFPGTGIGLATAQRIVHRHGGRIWAESRPSEGATFLFTLPGRREAGES
jgi:PAS domain S-box-containing protein